MPRKIVRLKKPYASANPGEVCGFEMYEATALVLRGMAEWATPEQAEGTPQGPLPKLRTMILGGQETSVAPNIRADAEWLRKGGA